MGVIASPVISLLVMPSWRDVSLSSQLSPTALPRYDRLSLLTICFLSVECLQVQRFTVTPPESLNVTRGSEVTLPCKVEHRHGMVQWVKDGLTLGYNRNITGYPRYVVTGVEAEGEYDLKISSIM